MNKLLTAGLLVLIGLLAGLLAGLLVGNRWYHEPTSADQRTAGSEPLYWVAPMDPNYRRDQPGKSPMGMELIPVYADADTRAPGTVRISADVVNNLGVRTELARPGTLQTRLTTVGFVTFNEDRLLHIHPRVSGWIEKQYVRAAGDPVQQGAPLYDLYSPQLVNAQEELLLALNRGDRRLISAARERLTSLQVADTVIDQLSQKRQVSQTITFVSPQSGVVDNLNIRDGFYVQPGNTLMSIGNLDNVWVEGEIFARQAALVSVGDPVTMTLDYLPGRQWRGAVEYIYPTLSSETRTVTIRVSVDNPDHQLKPGMFAQLQVHHQSDTARLLIADEAVIRTGSQNRVVLALGEGRFKSVAVKTGRWSDQQVEILDGLVAGDRVVTSAQFLLDSESSRDSDFTRLHHSESAEQLDSGAQSTIETATVNGVINHVDRETRRLNISRDGIEKWHRGPATMDFVAADQLPIQTLQPGTPIRFTFEIVDGEFRITRLNRLQEGHRHD